MPYCIYRKASNGKYVGQYSVDLELLHILEKRFNFRSNLLHSNDNWAQIVNGSWTGVVGNIVNGISQIGMCMLSFTPERSRVIDLLIKQRLYRQVRHRNKLNSYLIVKLFGL